MKNKKHLAHWLCLLLIVVAIIGVTVVSAAPKDAPTGLVLEDMPIILPANPTDVEKSAAKELQHYLKEMTGTSSTFLTEGVVVDSAIYIGATKFASENNITLEAGAYTDQNGNGEGWVIKTVGNNLVLTGGEVRGVLYAVYHLLEDEFGIHWWNYWEEYVPTMEDAVVPYGFESSGEPAFVYRDIYIGRESVTNLFLARNRTNGFMTNAPQAYGGEEDFTRPYHVHTFNRYFVPYYEAPTSASSAKWLDAINPNGISWYEEYPEWFAWSDVEGKRISHGQMCLSNEEFIKVFTEKALIAVEMSYKDADAAGKARPKYLDITPNDKGGFCECDACEASLAQSGPSGHLLKFVNKIANNIYEIYPEITVETLAYWQYFEVPLDDTVPADNMVIRLASSDVDVLHNLDHPNNELVKQRLHAWAKILKPGQLWYWDYAISMSTVGSFPDYFKYQPDYQQFYEAGGRGIFTELEYVNTLDFWDLKVWIMTKIMEDPYVDQYALTKEFLNKYYGEAAAEDIYNYLILATESAEDYYEKVNFGTAAIEAPWMTAEEVLAAYHLFEAAVEKTQADSSLTEKDRELFLNRINVARKCVDVQILHNYNRYVEEMGKNNDPERIFDVNKTEIGRRYVATLQWVSRMELENDHTGVQTVLQRGEYDSVNSKLASYQIYLTEKDDLQMYLPYLEVPEQIYEDHPGVSDNHIYDFPSHMIVSAASYISGMYDVENGASYNGGTAVMWDLEELYEKEEKEYVDTNYAYSESQGIQSTLSKKLYLNNPIIADGEYHLYRIKNVVASLPTFKQFRFFGDTVYVDLGEYSELVNKPVDVYVSLKVEGDPTGKDPRNYAKTYLDRLLIVDYCTMNYSEEIPATCASNAKQKGYCVVCGKVEIKEIPYTKLPHAITSGYTYDAESNVYTAACSVCGEAQFKFYGQLPDEVMDDVLANGTSLDFVYDYGAYEFQESYGRTLVVEDSDSLTGKAACYDLAKVDVLEMFKITDTKPLGVAYDRLSPKLYAKDITADGEYHIYKFEDVNLVTNTEDTLIFFDWTFQVNFGALPIKGQKVDLYMSMKIDGELNYDDPNNLPVYYFDRMIVVGSCENHKTGSFIYDAATHTYEGACDNCGGVITKKFVDDLPQAVLDSMEASGTNVTHVHEYVTDKLTYNTNYDEVRGVVQDPAAAGGQALKYDTTKMTRGERIGSFTFASSKAFALTNHSSGRVFGSIPAATLKANSNDGQYHLYKWTNVLIPENHIYTWGFDWTLQMYFDDISSSLEGKTVEGYLSMKIDGDPTYTGSATSKMPKYYIDRFVVVDNCENHLDEDSMTITSQASCSGNAVASGKCALCGRMVTNIEMEDTQLSHDFGEFIYDEASGLYVASCSNGCGTTRTKGDLPQLVLDDLAASGMDQAHAHEYGPDNFTFRSVFTVEDDAEAVTGIAARARARDCLEDPGSYILYAHESFAVSQSTGTKLGSLTYNMLQPNANKGYQLYKLEDLKLDANMEYVTLFDGDLRIPDMAELAGKTVDLYISIKIVGNIHTDTSPELYPIYYVDRVIAVDSCDEYDIEYSGGFACLDKGGRVGTCPVCGREFTADGATMDHSFTRYEQDKLNKNNYVAYCDYGCGTTDTKTKKAATLEDILPDELPASVKNHVIVSYDADKISMDDVRWDLELDRPVGVRSYVEAKTTSTRNALNMSMAREIPINLWQGGSNTEILGRIKPDELSANSGKGYQLYLLDDIVPIQYNEYRYLYMFNDWGVYIEMFDDDLRDYKNQVLDVYLYMKVEGDPNCQTDQYPIYYIDQLFVATSCQVDETWTITKEATCTEKGEAIGDCAICGLQDAVVSLPKTPHQVINSYMKEAPTCEEDMVLEGYCTVCKMEYREMKVENSKLTHSFTKYVKQEDGSGREIAYCDYGCGERHIRSTEPSIPELPESVQQILPMFGAGGGAFNFSDVKSSDWYFDSVKEAWSNGLVNGVTATEFRPNDTLTVAQAVKLASAYHEKYNTGTVTLANGSGNWYSSYVDYAVENGIIDSKYAGYSNPQMNKTIDRSEFVSIFAKAMDDSSLVGYNKVADNAIPDVKMSDANADAIYKFYRAGILTGSDAAGTFNPASSIKRSEVAAILSRMFNEGSRQSITLN